MRRTIQITFFAFFTWEVVGLKVVQLAPNPCYSSGNIYTKEQIAHITKIAIPHPIIRFSKFNLLLKLGNNVFSIGILAQLCKMRSNTLHKHFPLGRLRNVNHFLHNIVCILVLHHDVQWTCRHPMINTQRSLLPQSPQSTPKILLIISNPKTYPLSVLYEVTSSMRTVLSCRDEYVTHFSTTLEANLCCE